MADVVLLPPDHAQRDARVDRPAALGRVGEGTHRPLADFQVAVDARGVGCTNTQPTARRGEKRVPDAELGALGLAGFGRGLLRVTLDRVIDIRRRHAPVADREVRGVERVGDDCRIGEVVVGRRRKEVEIGRVIVDGVPRGGEGDLVDGVSQCVERQRAAGRGRNPRQERDIVGGINRRRRAGGQRCDLAAGERLVVDGQVVDLAVERLAASGDGLPHLPAVPAGDAADIADGRALFHSVDVEMHGAIVNAGEREVIPGVGLDENGAGDRRAAPGGPPPVGVDGDGFRAVRLRTGAAGPVDDRPQLHRPDLHPQAASEGVEIRVDQLEVAAGPVEVQ